MAMVSKTLDLSLIAVQLLDPKPALVCIWFVLVQGQLVGNYLQNRTENEYFLSENCSLENNAFLLLFSSIRIVQTKLSLSITSSAGSATLGDTS